MAKSSFGRRFHDLKYFEDGFFFISFKFIIYLRSTLQNFVEKYQFSVILSCFKHILDNYMFNIPT